MVPDDARLRVQDDMAIERRRGLAHERRVKVIEIEQGRISGADAAHQLDPGNR